MANRKNTFLIKRSNIAGKVPAAGDLLLGELAINTADGILYASGTTANSILPIGWDRVARTGDTMTGTLFAPSISATTISATTYYGNGSNLTGIAGSTFTGGTVTGPTTFTNGLTANTISATTYFNLPTDVFVTGGTYSTGTTIFTNSTGATFSVSGYSTGTTVGNGTANYLTKWTGSTGQSNSIIRDDGTNIGVNIIPSSSAKFKVYSTGNTYSIHAQGGTYSIYGENTTTGGIGGFGSNSSSSGYGLYGSSNGGYGAYASSSSLGYGVLIGIKGSASGFGTAYSAPTGVFGDASGDYGAIGVLGSAVESEVGSGVYIGGKFISYQPSAGGTNYSLWLVDGTEGINKVLVSKTTDGKANWSSTLSGLTGVYTSVLSATTVSATTVSATIVSATTVSATTLIGDGSQITNIAVPYGIINAIATGNYLI